MVLVNHYLYSSKVEHSLLIIQTPKFFVTIDASFKTLFGDLVSKFGWNFKDSLKVGTLPLEIDAVVEFSENGHFEYLRPFLIVIQDSRANRIIIEFKSHKDRLKLSDVPKLLAYRYLFLHQFDPSVSTRTAEMFLTIFYQSWYIITMRFLNQLHNRRGLP